MVVTDNLVDHREVCTGSQTSKELRYIPGRANSFKSYVCFRACSRSEFRTGVAKQYRSIIFFTRSAIQGFSRGPTMILVISCCGSIATAFPLGRL